MTYFVLFVLLTETAEKPIYKTNNFMKKIVFILQLIALFVTGCQKNNNLKVTLTEAEECDQFIERYSILYFDKGDANLKLVDSKKMGNKVTLVYNSLITEIGDDAFNGESSLKSVEIPNSVTEIGNLAFACTSLKSIELPDSVTEIGGGAFAECTSLKKVRIPKNTHFDHNSFPEDVEIIEY